MKLWKRLTRMFCKKRAHRVAVYKRLLRQKNRQMHDMTRTFVRSLRSIEKCKSKYVHIQGLIFLDAAKLEEEQIKRVRRLQMSIMILHSLGIMTGERLDRDKLEEFFKTHLFGCRAISVVPDPMSYCMIIFVYSDDFIECDVEKGEEIPRMDVGFEKTGDGKVTFKFYDCA